MTTGSPSPTPRARTPIPSAASPGFSSTKTSPIWKFVGSSDWDPVNDAFGALPFAYGTLVTSLLALAAAVPVGLGLSIFLTELAPPALRKLVAFGVELLAGIPSVVFGLWG